MKTSNTIFTAIVLLAAITANAQVKFKLTFDELTKFYTVWVIPQNTYESPQNITGTGQVTIKVPSNQFDPVDLTNHSKGLFWEANSRNNTPKEAPNFDYISFGLIIQGIAFPQYVKGEEMALFSFRNAYGCSGMIALVDNQKDTFFPPNSHNSNIGNTLTILGAGGDAYAGIAGPAECDCQTSLTNSEEELKIGSISVFPNPASEKINAQLNWTGESKDVVIQIVDATGKKVESRSVKLHNGQNMEKFDIYSWPPATYWINVKGESLYISLGKFTKQ